MATVTRTLPGIRIDAAPPAPVEALPRMDVAVFVGFAATGPLHLPVALESVAQYAAVFGPDLTLAWDADAGIDVKARLGPTVRGFFSNGGRRCWVIRVARTAGTDAARGVVEVSAGRAVSNRFAVPGVLALRAANASDDALHASPAPSDVICAATVQARCEGAWSDRVRVSTALRQRGVAIEQLALIPSLSPGLGSPDTHVRLRARVRLEPGDLLDLGEAGVTTLFARVDSASALREPGGSYTVDATLLASFARLDVESTSPPQLSFGMGEVNVAGVVERADGTLAAGAAADGSVRIALQGAVSEALAVGHWARWNAAGTVVWVRVDEVTRESSDPAATVTIAGAGWYEVPLESLGSLESRRQVRLLSLDLRADDGVRQFRIDGLGLTPQRTANWWERRSDDEVFREALDEPQGARVVASDVTPFPLAPRRDEVVRAWLPLGVEPLYGDAVLPTPQPGTALERDGLAVFDASLFLDPELEQATLSTIIDVADGIRYLREDRRALFGMHAALSIGSGETSFEPSLIAVPDATHPGWTRRSVASVPVPNAHADEAPAHWRTHRGACAPTGRVVLDAPDFGEFLDAGTRALPTPLLSGPSAPVLPGMYTLSWQEGSWDDPLQAPTDGSWLLEEATQPDFADAREAYRGTQLSAEVRTERDGTYYYRLTFLLDGDRSAHSNTVVVQVRSAAWEYRRVADDADLPEREWLAVHRALLRLAAASGELFAVLSLPAHLRTEATLRYVQRLRTVQAPAANSDPTTLTFTEARALSYGALYYPWVQARVRGGEATEAIGAGASRVPLLSPPDGVATGVLASRAQRRGAWVAPANEVFRDIVAITPAVPESDRQALQDAQVNLLRADPRGLLTLSADTLSTDVELRAIHVRRLLILLRRVALRRGATYVFEPNGPVMRRAVQRTFDELLTDLFRRGAFSGATPAQAFRVVTDDTINTALDGEEGRLFVELRVAPAQAMRFITVRLTQDGERFTVAEAV